MFSRNTLSAGVATFLFSACSSPEPSARNAAVAEATTDRLYVAVEEDSRVAIVDAESGELLKYVDLTENSSGMQMRFTAHNAQASADGRMVWVTAMAAAEHGDDGEMPEQLIGIDTKTDAVTKRISLGVDLHVAHVVLAAEKAYVTANEADSVLIVDLEQGVVEQTIQLGEGAAPHGARLSADGKYLIAAGMGEGSVEIIALSNGEVSTRPLPGRAVQVAVLPDNTAVFATIYDAKQVARIDLASGEFVLWDMPAGSAGPVQIYPTRDSKHVWVADQGLLDGRPAGNTLVRFDVLAGAPDLVVPVNAAPHGVVVDAEARRVWTTTLVDGTVQSVDAVSGRVLTSVAVGNKPNGITCVHGSAAMP